MSSRGGARGRGGGRGSGRSGGGQWPRWDPDDPTWPSIPERPTTAVGTRPRVAVVGGGLAGISAALAAADAGAEVFLFEAKPRLGGLTASFQRSGLWVDTGQHVFLRCCVAYRALLVRLGVEQLTTLQPRLDVPVRMGDTLGDARLRRTSRRLPAPLHLAPALLGYQALPLRQRVAAGLAAFQLGRLDPTDPSVDNASFGDWLSRHHQGAAATEALWELLTVATINAPAAEASLGLAAKVVRTGLLERADGGDIGWADVPLQQLHGDAAAAALATAKAQVKLNTRVRSIRQSGTGWKLDIEVSGAGRRPNGGGDADDAAAGAAATGAGAGGAGAGRGKDGAGEDGAGRAPRPVRADAVVLAVSPQVADALLPGGAFPGRGPFAELGTAPIVNIHMIFDRKVLDVPFLAATSSPVQWIFDRTVSSGLAAQRPGAQYLALSQSAARDLVDRPAKELEQVFVDEVRRLLPAARDAELVEAFVTRERTATFQQGPGSLALRPPQRTELPGLAVAGAWTDTGWPATMEGAVRSGLSAARAAIVGIARTGSLLVHRKPGPPSSNSWDPSHSAGYLPASPPRRATSEEPSRPEHPSRPEQTSRSEHPAVGSLAGAGCGSGHARLDADLPWPAVTGERPLAASPPGAAGNPAPQPHDSAPAQTSPSPTTGGPPA